MSDIRILTAATSWVDNDTTRELVKLWWRVWAHLNPGEDIVLIDACSPFDPAAFLPPGIDIFRWPENVGAITRGGKDGAGRSCCKAIEIAAERGYDYVAIHETDFLFAKPMRAVCARMHKAGVKAACPGFAKPYDFAEFGVLFLDVRYAGESRFIERYSWQTSSVVPIVEMRIETLLGDDLWFLPERGLRNDQNQINIANIANMHPYKMPSWITHCADPNVYLRFLDLNGIHLS